MKHELYKFIGLSIRIFIHVILRTSLLRTFLKFQNSYILTLEPVLNDILTLEPVYRVCLTLEPVFHDILTLEPVFRS